MARDRHGKYVEYLNRESTFRHAPYNPEMDFYNAVKKGNINKIRRLYSNDFTKKEGLGKLSDSPLRNYIYHFVIACAMIARSCIEGGMTLEEAYTASDYYIMAADSTRNLADLSVLHNRMVLDYTTRMRRIANKHIGSRHILSCINYIDDNLHTRITIKMLSAHTGLSESYLSKLFKQETGQSLSEYIARKKTETAGNMIAYSDYSLSEISAILAFPSQSYFTQCFKKYMGCTPGEYRNDTVQR